MLLFAIRWGLVAGGALCVFHNAQAFFQRSQATEMLLFGITLVFIGAAMGAWRHATNQSSSLATIWMAIASVSALADVLFFSITVM